LVVRLSALGDLVLISPVLDYLSAKGEVHLITYPAYAPLYEGDPRVSDMIVVRRRGLADALNLASALSARDYEVMFDLQVKPFTLVLGHALTRRGVRVIRTSKRSLRRRLHVWFGLPLSYEYIPRLHLRAVASHFGEEPPDIRPSLKVSRRPDRLPDRYVVLAPEGSAPLKRWDFSNFSALAVRLNSRGYTPVWVGTEREPKVAVGLDLRGRTDIRELVGVVAGAKALVGNDSSAVHIAYATGVPAVVVMGPTTKSFGFVPPDGVMVAELPLKCRPCSTNGSGRCMVGGRPCMDLSVEDVLSILDAHIPHSPI